MANLSEHVNIPRELAILRSLAFVELDQREFPSDNSLAIDFLPFNMVMHVKLGGDESDSCKLCRVEAIRFACKTTTSADTNTNTNSNSANTAKTAKTSSHKQKNQHGNASYSPQELAELQRVALDFLHSYTKYYPLVDLAKHLKKHLSGIGGGDGAKKSQKKMIQHQQAQQQQHQHEQQSGGGSGSGGMKTALDVIKRILWDESIAESLVTIGYVDRFLGVLEKPFSVFSWEHLAAIDYYTFAIPKHRIAYFKYRNRTVWHKARRIDHVFGSSDGLPGAKQQQRHGRQQQQSGAVRRIPTILDIIENYESDAELEEHEEGGKERERTGESAGERKDKEEERGKEHLPASHMGALGKSWQIRDDAANYAADDDAVGDEDDGEEAGDDYYEIILDEDLVEKIQRQNSSGHSTLDLTDDEEAEGEAETEAEALEKPEAEAAEKTKKAGAPHAVPTHFKQDNCAYWRDKLRPNFFVCVRVTDPAVVAQVAHVQRVICERQPLYTECAVPPHCLHITLATLCLNSAEQVADCCRILNENRADIESMLPSHPLQLLAGVERFFGRVLYAKVAHTEALLKLVEFFQIIFRAEGIPLQEEHREFVAHCSLIKVTRPVARQLGTKIISKHLLEGVEYVEFGEQPIESIRLCSMEKTRDADGFYVSPAALTFDKKII